MLTLLPTPIGNIADITYRTLTVLESCELILCEDTRVTKHLLSILKERYSLTLSFKDIYSFHEYNGKERLEFLAERIKNEKVVYMSDAGMPVISDPGQLLVEFCQKNGVEYDVLPGASAAPLVYAASGFESRKFYFYGFLPSKGGERSSELAKVMSLGVDTILYEAPHRIIKLIEEIATIDENREVFLAKELTKKHQKYYRNSAKALLETLKNNSTKGEWALVIAAHKEEQPTLTLQELLQIDMPPKVKAKLMAKLSGKSVKECYEELRKVVK
jgi:16S rRNA (cytidine1402-2'-O)-methyltransferase